MRCYEGDAAAEQALIEKCALSQELEGRLLMAGVVVLQAAVKLRLGPRQSLSQHCQLQEKQIALGSGSGQVWSAKSGHN